MWIVGFVIALLVGSIPVQAVRRGEMRLGGPTIIGQARHPILFWGLVVLFALATLATVAGTLGTAFS